MLPSRVIHNHSVKKESLRRLSDDKDGSLSPTIVYNVLQPQ